VTLPVGVCASLHDSWNVGLVNNVAPSEYLPVVTSVESETLRMLAGSDPELAYLALLTARGIKPLSRWEKTLPEGAAARLSFMGLKVASVPRRVEQGEIIETVFSLSAELTGCYCLRFRDTLVGRTADVVRVQGFLFGYPGCCVEAFLREPYRPNGLAQADQRILFHWACPGCPVTPLMVPHYRWAHDIVEKLCPGFGGVSASRSSQR
jgi:hypothetical protein